MKSNYDTISFCFSRDGKINAIEEFFSQLKHYINKKSHNTYEDIVK